MKTGAGRILALTAALVFAAPVGAQTGGFCHALEQFAQSQAGTPIPLPDHAGLVAECREMLLLSGSRGRICSWSFDYRSAAAQDAFEGLLGAVASCLGPDAEAGADLPVNHPDSYDLRVFDMAGGRISVSLKDKAGEERSYLSLSVELTP